jgi:CBS domain-containing protein
MTRRDGPQDSGCFVIVDIVQSDDSGERREFTVSDVMTRRVATVRPQATLRTAVQAFSQHGFHHLPVIDQGNRPVGVLSDRDLLRECLAGTLDQDQPIETLMTRMVASVKGSLSLRQAARRFCDLGLNSLLVVDDAGRLIGLVTTRDLARLLAAGS